MLLTFYVAWISYPLVLSGTRKALEKGKPKALERSGYSRKNFVNILRFGMPKNSAEHQIATPGAASLAGI